ncbi:hypothetical protein CA51_49110 [Rosistilla oblonga]|uniref:Hemerythrin-like domain-containing protein n=1 Tax=Rosistilla oblonga TaxID=2527990 RepID=A0A518IUV0_9BACT|nr:hypothetical protein [Rosistilla oblonga]QDV15001.1 hypothetical protein CA51_49110 [Rosistilla oblonga]QDV56850.1 hypothetical protein Mal33_28510 [Rosistilla oblonga]
MLMRTKVRTLTVNPAFLQEIKESNRELWDTLHAVRQTCDGGGSRAEIAKRLVRLLDQLRDHLSLQFALEESYGYLECPAVVERRISEAAERAQAQHCRLFLQLTDLCELAEELQYRGFVANEVERLIGETEAFDLDLQSHERCEDDLIEIAYFDLKR